MARSIKEVHTINYYSINEGAARRAKEMNSFSDYKEGSATAEYRAMVDKATDIAEQQKSRVDPMYHEKIDQLLDTYTRKRQYFLDGLDRIGLKHNVPQGTYFVLIDIQEVMLRERLMPPEFINEAGNGVTPAFVEWCKPLIGPELPPILSYTL